MDEAVELSLLIGDIYDASLDRALWPDAVNRICTYLRACMASLISQDAVSKAVDVHFMLGPEQKFLDQYNEKYFKINPIFPTVMFLEIEQKNVLSDVLPLKDFVQTRFAKEWIQPQGIVDGLFSTLEKSPSGCTVLMTMRHKAEGFFDDRLVAMTPRLYHHGLVPTTSSTYLPTSASSVVASTPQAARQERTVPSVIVVVPPTLEKSW